MATEHFKQNPLIHPVPTDRLTVPDPTRLHFVKDDGNRLTWSGLDLVDSMHMSGLSTKGLFCKENVIVLPRQMSFGLKEVNIEADAGPLDMTERVDNYIEYVRFLCGRVEDVHGAEVVGTLPLFKGLEMAALDVLQDDQLLDLLLYYPALLPIDSKGILFCRIYNRIVKRVPLLHKAKLPVIGFKPNAKKKINNPRDLCKKLLRAVPYSNNPSYPNWGSVIAARNPDVFKCFVTQSKMDRNSSIDLVALLRHAPAHPLEKSMIKLLTYLKRIKQGKPLPPSSVLDSSTVKSAQFSTLSTVPPSCTEVLHLMFESFPKYLPNMSKAFWTYSVYGGWMSGVSFLLAAVDSCRFASSCTNSPARGATEQSLVSLYCLLSL